MSNFVISLVVAVSASTWLYAKFARRGGGGNATPALIGAAVVGLILLVILYISLSTFVKH